MQTNSIADNCRSILRKYGGAERSNGCNPFSQQENRMPSNPIYSFYGVDNLQIPLTYCEEPSYSNTLSGLCSVKLPRNSARQPTCMERNLRSMRSKQINQVRYPSNPSDNCIQMITNAILSRIRSKIPEQEIALLCCCLPGLIRQVMCQSPWLTPDDIIQWLSGDIIKESMHDLTQSNTKRRNQFPSKAKQTSQFRKDPVRQTPEQTTSEEDERDFSQPHQSIDDNQSLLSYGSARRDSSEETPKSQHSVLNIPSSNREMHRRVKGSGSSGRRLLSESQSKTKASRSPSTRSFTSQRIENQDSLASPSMSMETRSKKSSIPDERSVLISNDQMASPHLDDDFSEKSVRLAPKQRSRTRLAYPGKIDSHAAEEVENCLAFYDQMREYFDANVAAMLFKCCLCSGGCSGRN